MQEDKELQAIAEAVKEIWEIGERLGLDPFPTHFEVVPANILYEFGAYGLPGRFSHWTHGKAYHQMKTMYDYGLSKIYELVINTDPCYAFLLEGNSLVQNKLVIAHVMAHSDFFKNNIWFSHTNRQMVEEVSTHAQRIDQYVFEHGPEEVEAFLDAVLSIQEHVDPHFRIRKKSREEYEAERRQPTRYHTEFDDLWELEERKKPRPQGAVKPRKNPPEPEKDILKFIAENAPDLEEWQRDIIWIVRDEMLYFVPQIQTKIMNEGWASYWHAQIMRELDLPEAEFLEYAELNAAVTAPLGKGRINPYHVGLKIWEDIRRRWDEPTDQERKELGRQPGKGLEKIFEVRELENDVSFLRNYLTEELVEELDLFIYRKEGDQWIIVDKDWEHVRDQLVHQMTNLGFPYICVEDGDYRRNSELYLKHYYEGRELDLHYAKHTLRYVQKLWGRPVHLETVVDNHRVLLSTDGEKDSIAHLDEGR